MTTPSRDILIVGGGVIGLCAGWFLGRAGHRVTILDRDPTRGGSCSPGNAGMIVPSHFIPLAAPGVIRQGLAWMRDPQSPFAIRPRLDGELIRWGWHFWRNATARHVQNSQTLLRDLSLASRRLFDELSEELEFTFVRRGLLMLCRTLEGLEHESHVAETARALGLEAEVCDPARLKELEPDTALDVAGGVWFSQDGHLDPATFLAALEKGLLRQGGRILPGEAARVESDGRRVTGIVTTDGSRLTADTYLLAGGAWTPALARTIGLRLPMQAGKGYSLTLTTPRRLPRLCALLQEARVAVTPMGETLRVAGTMEICGNDLSISAPRVRGIIESFCRFYPDFRPDDFAGIAPWCGLRPCSPDGLPYIGRIQGLENGLVATGHAMLGLSLGPVTGQIIAELVDGRQPEIDISKLAPGRF